MDYVCILVQSRVHNNLIKRNNVLLMLQYFINILQAAFTSADPNSAKIVKPSSLFFALLGSARVKCE